MSAATIGLQNGVLTLAADPNTASTMKVEFGADHSSVTASINNQSETFRFNQIKSLVLTGSTQDDTIYVDPKLGLPAQILANGGNDIIWGGTGLDNIDGGTGNDQIHGHGALTTGSGNDTVWGSNLGDSIYAGSGTDLIVAGNGNNVIYGGTGNDTIISGTGNDNITAGSGTTVMYGSVGNDTLVGGTGNDTIYGGTGPNIIVEKSATTVVHAQPRNDVRIGYTTTAPSVSSAKRPARSTGSSSGASASQNDDPSDPVVASPLAPIPVITQLESTITAGEGVNVNALSSTILVNNQLTTTYSWNFGDPGSEYNVLPGFSAGHIYDNPGTYTITLTMTDAAGGTATATSQVTVTPDNRPIIYVDTNGSDSNTGLSPSQAVQTVSRAFALATSDTKIEFERGETFDVPYTEYIDGHDIYLGAYGTGANPVLMWTGGEPDTVTLLITPTSSNITIQGLTFDSPNAVTDGEAPEVNDIAIWAGGTNLVVEDNTFLNVDDAINGTTQPQGVIEQDNDAPLIQGLRGYFAWVDGTNWTIVGNDVANSTRQHDIRGNATDITGVLIYDNSLSKAYPADDPDDAYKTTINFREGSNIFISNNTLTDGTVAFGPSVVDQTPDQSVDWVVLQDNVINDTQVLFNSYVHHVMMDNNVINLTGSPQIYVQPGDLTVADGYLTDITITHNTGINLGSTGQFMQVTSNLAPGTLTLTDNLYEAPNLAFGLNDNAALWLSTTDLSGFANISGNIWPAPNNLGDPGVVNYLYGATTPSGYLSPQQWDAMTGTPSDQFSDEAPASGTYSLTLNGVTAGATTLPLAA